MELSMVTKEGKSGQGWNIMAAGTAEHSVLLFVVRFSTNIN